MQESVTEFELKSAQAKRKTKTLRNVTRTQQFVTYVIYAVVLFLVAFPLLQLVISSFNQGKLGEAYDFTFSNYKEILNNLNLYGNSIFVAVMGTLVSTILGVTLAFVLGRTDIPLRGVLSTLIVIPFFIDSFFGAIAWVLLGTPESGFLNIFFRSVFGLNFSPFNIYSPWGIIWVFGIYYTPFTFLLTSGALKSMDPSLEEASYVLGGGRIKTTMKVTLPLIMPAIMGGALLSMVMAIEQFSVPAIIGNQAKFSVVPTAIYHEMVRFPPTYGVASALGLSLLLFTFIGTYLHNRVLANKSFQTITGKNFRPRLVKVGKFKWLLLCAAFLYIFIAVVLPIGTILWASFLKYITNTPADMKYTVQNYKYVLFNFPGTKKAILNSVLLAGLGASIVCILMGISAWIIHRRKSKFTRILEYTAMIPVAVPSMVLSIGLFWAWIKVPGVYGTIWVILIAYVTVYLPQGLRSISASLIQIDKSLEESAAVVGASWLTRFRTILLPLLAEGMISAWTLVFILIMHNLGASLLLSSSKNPVLPMAIYNLWENGNFTQLSALATVQISIILVVLAITKLITRKLKVSMGGE
jgi:iron(III) transport system permease protein